MAKNGPSTSRPPVLEVLSESRRTLSRMFRRFWNRQSEDHIFFVAGSLAFYSLIALVPVSAVCLSLYVSFFEKEQKAVYDWAVRYVFPFSQGTKFDFRSIDKPHLDAEGSSGSEDFVGPIQAKVEAAPLLVSSTPGDATPVTEAERKLAEFEQTIEENIALFLDQAQKVGPIGLIFFIITGIFLFDSIEDAFNTIWRVKKRRPFIKRFINFWTFLAFLPIVMVGPMLLDQFIEKRVMVADLSWLRFLYGWLWLVLPFCLTWFAIWMMYVHLPNESVDLKAAGVSALVVALCWEIAKRLFAHYVSVSHNYQIVYGSLAIVLFVLSWTYYTWWLLLQGLELTACIQFPSEDQLTSPWELAPEVRLLYSWGGIHETGNHFEQGKGPISLNRICEALGLNHARVKPLLEELEKKGLLAQDKNGNWLPAVPLDRITWRDVAQAYEVEDVDTTVRLSEWLESALQARGVVGYKQDTSNLPSLSEILRRKTEGIPPAPAVPSLPDPAPHPVEDGIEVVEAEVSGANSESSETGSTTSEEERKEEC